MISLWCCECAAIECDMLDIFYNNFSRIHMLAKDVAISIVFYLFIDLLCIAIINVFTSKKCRILVITLLCSNQNFS